MSNSGHTLSIICVALNEERYIAGLKQAIDALERPGEARLETIFIDGGSEDGTAEAARRAGFDQVIVLSGASIPACRNHGARVATGNWIAYLDADCEPDVEWWIHAAPWLEKSIPTVVGWPAGPPEPPTWVQSAWHLHWMHKGSAWVELEGKRVVVRQAFRLLTTRNLLMNREVFETLDGFDESLATGEDTEFVRRADDRGMRVVGLPDLQVFHHGEPATLWAFFKQQLWHANRTAYRTLPAARGSNAQVFTILYLCTAAVAFVSALAAITMPAAAPLLGTLPFLALLLIPAAGIAIRAQTPRSAPALMVLYGLYGLARAIDLLGLHREKRTWKSTP